MQVTIYHNPKCAKSRTALRLLEARGIRPKIVEYLKNPPTTTEIKRILKMLDMQPRELLRSKEPEFKQAGLEDPRLSNTAVIYAMLAYPKLIERPIVVTGERAVLGRPPENILRILK